RMSSPLTFPHRSGHGLPRSRDDVHRAEVDHGSGADPAMSGDKSEAAAVLTALRQVRNSVASASDRNPIIIGGLPSQVPDFDPEETQEWLDSLDAAVDARGRERARYLMLRLIERAREKRVAVPEMRST